MRILLVDDDRFVRATLASGLTGMGHEVLDVESAELALEMLDGARVDVIVSDIEMPGIGGLAFVRALRSRPHRPPCVALTASHLTTAQDEAMRGLFDSVLTKPVSVTALHGVLAGLVGR